MKISYVLSFLAALMIGCGSDEIPQAHKGRMFDRTGALALWSGGDGFTGPILGPGTHYTGIYDELRTVDCSQSTVKETLSSLTKDGVQFNLDVYIQYSADCSDKTIEHILTTMSPKANAEGKVGNVITSQQIYDTFVRPALGEAVRQTVSPVIANEVNEKREEILDKAKTAFMSRLDKEPKLVTVFEVNLSNLDFPEAMDAANTDRAVQAVLKDKAIAERERVTAEIETTKMKRGLAENEGDAIAAKIDKIGAALKRNPDYLQYDLQNKMPEIYKDAGAKGNMILTAPSPQLVMPIKPQTEGK